MAWIAGMSSGVAGRTRTLTSSAGIVGLLAIEDALQRVWQGVPGGGGWNTRICLSLESREYSGTICIGAEARSLKCSCSDRARTTRTVAFVRIDAEPLIILFILICIQRIQVLCGCLIPVYIKRKVILLIIAQIHVLSFNIS